MSKIIDFHTHTFFSDGVLSPAELVRRAECNGYGCIALTDHADSSNLEFLLERLVKFVRETQPYLSIKIIPGVELTHVPPAQVKPLTERARKAGARIVVLHGETICEPVPPGTNRAGIEAGIDILAHPGLISEEEVKLAAEKGVFLEVSARKSHGLGNGRVVQLARKTGARLVLNTDSHAPSDLFTMEWQEKVGCGAGLSPSELEQVRKNMYFLMDRLFSDTKSV
ncbi:MAG: histidinol phosphate phosphatase domain-containing protein [Spirochaetales bacterium]|nr:histidinol phosphate phosphatase domain-containing protein [Spirochaetales bacterium]